MFGNQISTPSAIEPDDEAALIHLKSNQKLSKHSNHKQQDSNLLPDQSFNNSSLNYEDFVDQMTPS